LDLFRIDLAQSSVVRIETFDPSAADCAGFMTTLRLHDAAGAQLYADDNSGISTCSALLLSLPAGTYYAQVEERGNDGTIAAYALEVKVISGGSEAEANDTAAAANALSGAEVLVLGGHPSNDDSDFFAITVPPGKSIRAEIIEGGAETCESNSIDSALTLYDAGGVALGDDDDGGRGFCSAFDGTGSSPASGFAHALPGGTYYLQVEAAAFAQTPGDPTGQFDYRLVVTIR
ncbi:MAG: pre-peptidase C-terminal domain-containing protein, partial [Polyangiaceae bacterium]|nr:pre-peptidase C-terminal domain-containing protein [Polyangiaceae bacterium]